MHNGRLYNGLEKQSLLHSLTMLWGFDKFWPIPPFSCCKIMEHPVRAGLHAPPSQLTTMD